MSKGVSVNTFAVGEANNTVAVGVLTGSVAASVLDGTAVFGAVVEVGTEPTGAPPEPENVPEFTSRYPMIVRALFDLIIRGPIGIRFMRGR